MIIVDNNDDGDGDTEGKEKGQMKSLLTLLFFFSSFLQSVTLAKLKFSPHKRKQKPKHSLLTSSDSVHF